MGTSQICGQGGNIVVGRLGPGIENVILFQCCEPFGFVGWERGFHFLMAFNARQRNRRRQGWNGIPNRDHGWPVALNHKSDETSSQDNLSQVAPNDNVLRRRECSRACESAVNVIRVSQTRLR